jgi:hypothetical protein
MRGIARIAAACGLVAAIVACNEEISSPAPCSENCVVGPVVHDTVIFATPGGDTSFSGYLAADQAFSLLVSTGLVSSEDRAWVRYFPRADSVFIPGDSLRPYSVDSAAISIYLQARDTLAKNLVLRVYRLPSDVDSTITFTQLDGYVNDPLRLIGSLPIADTLKSGRLRLGFSGTDTTKVHLTPADSGVLAIGFRIEADSATGVLLGSSLVAGQSAQFLSYVTAVTPDTVSDNQILIRNPEFEGTRQSNVVSPGPDYLPVGGDPSSRALIRFDLPPAIRDTSYIIRATLELYPTQPSNGLPNLPISTLVKGLLVDLGAKSPSSSLSSRSDTITVGSSAPVTMEIVNIVRSWNKIFHVPQALMVQLTQEGSSFSVPVFGSTRTPGFEPRLHITYQFPYGFERP